MGNLFNLEPKSAPAGPVECLGMTFPNDEERRKHFLGILREKLKDPEFRKIEGFPIGSDEDILALSDPPYYTACPNPFIEDFIRHYGKPYDPATDDYRREPFAADVSEGKNDPLYRLPSYHTKVPYKAIQYYLNQYTDPGDIVLDAFCGTGMTGLACLLCDADFAAENGEGRPRTELARHAILVDLSPAATFTASVMNSPLTSELGSGSKGRLGQYIRNEIIPLYKTQRNGRIEIFDYAVWSAWGECSECGEVFRIYDVAIDYDNSRMLEQYSCPKCRALLHSDSQKKAFSTSFDVWLGKPIRLAKTTMVLISKKSGNRAIRIDATEADVNLAEEVGKKAVRLTPAELPYLHMTHERNNLPEYWGITHIHHFYTRRNYYALSEIAALGDPDMRRAGLFCALTILENATRRNRFYVDNRRPKGSPVGPLSNTLCVPTIQVETNVGLKVLSVLEQIQKLRSSWPKEYSIVSTQSATQLASIPDASVDFIFTDPPFGGNINYSEQNILAEWWLRVFTNNSTEAITNTVQKKGIYEYQHIMTRCFSEYYRVLKPGRWMVVVFQSSANAIWSATQQALETAGFVVASVAILDKVHSTLHQDHKAAGAVKQALVISAYKPNGGLEERFKLEAGTEEGVWDFVRTHLKQLPVFVSRDGQAEIIAERQNYLLFDRMVAFHVQRGVTIPLSAAEFYAGLAQRFSERDGMYFLPEQVAEYDKKRMTVREVSQLQLFVTDESSAIQWLKQQLIKKPQTFQELHPQFLKEIGGWQKHEKPLELSELLEQNFLRYDGKGPIPQQIVSWMKQSEKMRRIIHAELTAGHLREESAALHLSSLSPQSSVLITRSKNRWYVPDPNKARDLEKLRERSLLKEFEDYRTSSQKRLKVFRIEAVRAGFKKAWQERDYATIIAVARKIPENVLQEDPKLLMWYDQALTRSGEE